MENINNSPEIRFSFDKDKFITVMQILSQRTPNLDSLKAVKLLYLIDREYLRTNGRPVLGDYYVAMEHGPVPSMSYDILKRILSGNSRDLPLSVDMNRSTYPVFITDEDPELSFLSETEKCAIEKVLSEYGSRTGWELRDITHCHAAWMESQGTFLEGPNQIDYKLFQTHYTLFQTNCKPFQTHCKPLYHDFHMGLVSFVILKPRKMSLALLS